MCTYAYERMLRQMVKRLHHCFKDSRARIEDRTRMCAASSKTAGLFHSPAEVTHDQFVNQGNIYCTYPKATTTEHNVAQHLQKKKKRQRGCKTVEDYHH